MKTALTSLLLLFLLIANYNSFGQVTKCKSTSCAYRTKNESTGVWNKWSDSEETEVLITFSANGDRIKIFSKTEQTYDVIQTYDKVTDKDGDDVIKYICVNEDGIKCSVRLVKLNSQDGRKQLYIGFSDMMWLYNINVLD